MSLHALFNAAEAIKDRGRKKPPSKKQPPISANRKKTENDFQSSPEIRKPIR